MTQLLTILCLLIAHGTACPADELPRLPLKQSRAASIGFFHIVRIPSDGATLVLTLRAFVERDRISLEFADMQPRWDRSIWPGESWAALLQLDATSLTQHSSGKVRRQPLPPPQAKRLKELRRISGYSLAESLFAVRDSRINRNVLRSVSDHAPDSPSDGLTVGRAEDGRVTTLVEKMRQAGSDTRQTSFSYDDKGQLTLLKTGLRPYWLDMSRQGYADLRVPWFSPTREVSVSLGKLPGSSLTVPVTVSVSIPWAPRHRLPLRQSLVFDFRPLDTLQAEKVAGHFRGHRLYESRMAYYKRCRQITAAPAQKRADVAQRIEAEWRVINPDRGKELLQSLDLLGFWRNASHDRKSNERYSEYLSTVQEILPDGLVIPLGIDLLQRFSAKRSSNASYDNYRRLIAHVVEHVEPEVAVGELLLVRRNCFFPATCLEMLRQIRERKEEVTPKIAFDIAYLEASLAVLSVQTRDGRNTNWDCVAEELRCLRKEVLTPDFERFCDGIQTRADTAWHEISVEDRKPRNRMPNEIKAWIGTAKALWKKPEKSGQRIPPSPNCEEQ